MYLFEHNGDARTWWVVRLVLHFHLMNGVHMGFGASSLVVFDYLFYDRVFHGLFHGPDGLVQ